MVYNNLGSLQTDINRAMYKACHEAALEFHAILFDYIMQDIYNHYKPNFYERTGEFLTKWLVEMSGSNTNSPLATIGLDTDTMTWNSEKFQHGNEYESAVNAIAEILFENKKLSTQCSNTLFRKSDEQKIFDNEGYVIIQGGTSAV